MSGRIRKDGRIVLTQSYTRKFLACSQTNVKYCIHEECVFNVISITGFVMCCYCKMILSEHLELFV